jgi:serine/threonine-protein kinase HipA
MTSTHTADPLTDDRLANLVANLRNAPLGIDRDVRVSLAGVQEKLLLTHMPDGRWGRPVGGTPSTHILKPEIERFENTVENEAFCMRVAKQLGLAAASVETILVDGRQVLVVERYDRSVDPDGTVERVHQEDFCQAFGLPPTKKYEDKGGPSLARMAGTLQDVADRSALDTLLRAVTLNLAIGNCDAHGKNFSLLHDRSGHVRLAPLYDLMSTRLYPIDDTLAMYVDGVQKADSVTADRIVNEASRWPIAKSRAREIVMDCLDRLPAAVEAVAADTDGIPPELTEMVERRIHQLRA